MPLLSSVTKLLKVSLNTPAFLVDKVVVKPVFLTSNAFKKALASLPPET